MQRDNRDNAGEFPPEFVVDRREHGKFLETAAPYVGEFIGTFMLVFTVCYVSFYHNPLFGCTAIGVVLMVLVYSIGPASGAHLNPAVSLTLFFLKKAKGSIVMAYMLCQILGGLCAGGAVYQFMGGESLPFGPADPYSWWQAMLVEVAYTFMLCFVVANVAASEGNNPETDKNCFYGLAIGFVVIAGAYGGGAISGGCFNPAVSLGVNIPFRGDRWAAIYCAYQVVGAFLAAVLTNICRLKERHSHDDERVQWTISLTNLVCEFLGTFMLVLTVGLNLTVASPAAAWSISAALMCMIYALGDVSGGHFNPAVTMAIFVCGKDPDKIRGPQYIRQKTAAYVTVQVIGGILAGMVYEAIHCSVSDKVDNFKLLGTGPVASSTWNQVLVAEVFFTFVLVFTVLSVAVYTKKDSEGQREYITGHKNHAALAIGLCVMAGGGAIGNISGGHLNPAVSFGVSTGAATICSTSESLPWGNCLLYALFQLGGGALASVVYFATHPNEFEHMAEEPHK